MMKVVDALSGPPQIAGLIIASYLIGSTRAAKALNAKVYDTYQGLEFVKRRQEARLRRIWKEADAQRAANKAMKMEMREMQKRKGEKVQG